MGNLDKPIFDLGAEIKKATEEIYPSRTDRALIRNGCKIVPKYARDRTEMRDLLDEDFGEDRRQWFEIERERVGE